MTLQLKKESLDIYRKRVDDLSIIDPLVPIKLRNKEYILEFNNYAVKGIQADTGYNLISTGFDHKCMEDPKIAGAMLYWGLKTNHPETLHI
jgi:hypothetical protein